jgi:hypothetical protein
MVKSFRYLLGFVLFFLLTERAGAQVSLKFYPADHSSIQYMGRIDFSNPKLPRFWQPGVTISFCFKGTDAEIILNDEQLWGSNQNYLELVVDGNAVRLQTKGKRDTLSVKPYLKAGNVHEVVLCKNTEANIGYLELAGIRCDQLLKPVKRPTRKIECIGNSITCGASSDLSGIPCGKGKWQDQHNAWLSYGAVTARSLDAQVHLSSVSGIGLMHSCCNLEILMPQVYDKISMRNDTIQWDFNRYQPDIVTVCLGQNDGVQDSTAFCNNYISFLKTLRGYYPEAKILLLSSPMADARLREFLRNSLKSVLGTMKTAGDNKLAMHVFEKSYTGGCDYHPSVEEHALIAKELTEVIRKWMKW